MDRQDWREYVACLEELNKLYKRRLQDFWSLLSDAQKAELRKKYSDLPF